MINDNSVYAELDKIFAEKQRKATAKSLAIEEILFNDSNYLSAYNSYNSARFEVSKAKFNGDKQAEKSFTEEMKNFKAEMDKIISNYGYSSKDFKPDFECKICKDTGTLEDGKRCKCYKKALSNLTLKTLGIENKKLPSFKKATFKDLNNLEKIYDKMYDYCQKFPNTDKNIVIAGTVGAGKSYLAGCIANEILSKGYNAVFISACELNSVLIKYHTAKIDDKGAYLDLLINCDLLIIDDLGSEPIYKNVTEEYLLMIVTERTIKGNPFIITTNLEQEQLLDRYGDRTLSRLNDKRHGVFIQIKGEDLRRKK
ncbi:MAG: hypothetical protein E7360_02515 [Clostridiales bacterium]|nr:hypothetical protein [Clostridiales bacterium]